MPLDPNMHMAQDQNDDDDDDTFGNVDQYFADHGYDGDFMGPPSQEPNPTKDVCDLAGTAEKPSCNMRRLPFSSQETPPAADFTEPQIGRCEILSAQTHSRRRSVSRTRSHYRRRRRHAKERLTRVRASRHRVRSVLRTGHLHLRISRGGCMWRVGRCYRLICSMLQPVLCRVYMTVFFL